MTKTKKQLRAEAVERLRECRYHTLSDYVRAMLGWGHEPHFEDSRDALIDLLTDDDSTISEVESTTERGMTNLEWLYEHDEYFNSFAKLIAFLRGFATDEFTANEWLRQEHYEPNPDCSAMLYWMYTENMKHEPCSDYEPKDDAVSIMRECAETSHGMGVLRGRLGVECVTGWQARCLVKLADMVERDYVRRDAVEEVMDNDRALVEENAKLASELEAAKLQIGQSDVPKSGETSENHVPKREIRDFDVSERYVTAFKWLDRLHYGEREADGDSREQLEADVREVCWGRNIYRFDAQKRYLKEHGLDVRQDIVTTNYEGHVLVNVIMHLLDRQAAITRQECLDTRVNFAERVGMGNKIDELTDERDHLRRQVDMLNGQVIELTAERDELKGQVFTLKSECDDLENDLHRLTAERDELQMQVDELTAERERYRSKFGKCIDYADAIHALMDDEGLA